MRDRYCLIVAALTSGLLGATFAVGQAAAGGSLKDPGAPEKTERAVWFSGYDVVEGSRYGYEGIVIALNGDLGRDGFFLRAYGSRGDFDLDPGDGRQWQADAALGYMFTRRNINFEVYAGFDYQNVKLKPDDPTAEVRGTETGFKFGGGLETEKGLPYYFSLEGQYSTAFSSYWARGRLGWHRDRFTFGPEASVVGDDDFDAQRLGAFLKFDVTLLPGRTTEITLSGGHQFNSDSGTTGIGGGSGAYGTIGFSTTF